MPFFFRFAPRSGLLRNPVEYISNPSPKERAVEVIDKIASMLKESEVKYNRKKDLVLVSQYIENWQIEVVLPRKEEGRLRIEVLGRGDRPGRYAEPAEGFSDEVLKAVVRKVQLLAAHREREISAYDAQMARFRELSRKR